MGAYAELCLALVNDLAIEFRHGRRVAADARLGEAFADLAANELMRHHELSSADVDALVAVARRLHTAVDACLAADVHSAALALNAVLGEFGAVPRLYVLPEGPQLTFHADDATIVGAWAAESATALAFLLATRQTRRLGQCSAEACDAYYLDSTKNASRRFCSLACQNRAKSSAYRLKRRGAAG